MRAEAAGAERPPGLALRGGPLRSSPASMAHLLTSGPPPDEQDFIQAYEEVREKYKGTEPLAPVCPFGRAGPSRLTSLTAGRVPSCCPRPLSQQSPVIRRKSHQLRSPPVAFGARGRDGCAPQSPRVYDLNRTSSRHGWPGWALVGAGVCMKQGFSGSTV